jgi:hypothetical protein
MHLGFAVCGYLLTLRIIPVVKEYTYKAELHGYDLNKRDKKLIPEALGIVPAFVYIVITILT